ncbi:MAG: four helix bundle protein [Verrucomicrobiia bacterium]
MALKGYRDLQVWQKAIELVESVYKLTKTFPAEERFGLASQLQRAAVSIPANIAEGYGRSHLGDYLHHLSIGRGSLAELETHLVIAVRLKILSREDTLDAWNLSQRVGQMLTKLIQSLQPSQPRSSVCKTTPRNPKPETRP